MRRLVYGLLALATVPAVSLASNPESFSLEQSLGFVGIAGNIEEEDLTDEEIEEALEEDVDLISDDDDEDEPQKSGRGSNPKLIKWRQELPKEDKKIFKKLMMKRRKKNKGTTDLGVKRAKILLERAKKKQEEKKQKA